MKVVKKFAIVKLIINKLSPKQKEVNNGRYYLLIIPVASYDHTAAYLLLFHIYRYHSKLSRGFDKFK